MSKADRKQLKKEFEKRGDRDVEGGRDNNKDSQVTNLTRF